MNRAAQITLGTVLVGASGVALWQVLGSSSRSDATIFFFDQSEEKLYRVSHGTTPPHAGTGGESGDGVRAIVLACPNDASHADDVIAYLESFTAEQADARRREAETGEPIPGLTRDWIADNTLLRKLDDPNWHAASSADGLAIRTQGIRQRCPVCEEWLRVRQPG